MENAEKDRVHQEKYLLGFSLLLDIGPIKFSRILKQFPDIATAWNFQEKHLTEAGISKNVQKLIEQRNKIDLDKEYLELKKENISILSPFLDENDFPKNLREISGAPLALFVKGEEKNIYRKQLAIIGTRRPTIYGKQTTEKLTNQIAQAGLTITSGMAIGIDSLAHKFAIENNQPTIAVLGNGLSNKILSQSFTYKLSQEIISSGGTLVSEYPPNFRATKFTFPARNRIISGLSLGVLVIEAGEKSGSLITARYALEQNREIFAVPGNIFSSQSIGTNWLIKEGAVPVTDANDILSVFGFSVEINSRTKSTIKFENPEEETIYKTINHEPMPIDKIAKIAKIDSKKLSSKLSLMELKGLIKNIGGGFIRG